MYPRASIAYVPPLAQRCRATQEVGTGSHWVSKRARRLVRPSMHMLRKPSLGWAAQTAIQSRSHAFQSAPFWATWAVGRSTASQPAACTCMHLCVSDTEKLVSSHQCYTGHSRPAHAPGATSDAKLRRELAQLKQFCAVYSLCSPAASAQVYTTAF